MMKEPKLKDKEKVIEKLKPFWKGYWKKQEKFKKEISRLEKEMTNKLKLAGIELEFFYVDGECVGIGASDFAGRKRFPLIHDYELNYETIKNLYKQKTQNPFVSTQKL